MILNGVHSLQLAVVAGNAVLNEGSRLSLTLEERVRIVCVTLCRRCHADPVLVND